MGIVQYKVKNKETMCHAETTLHTMMPDNGRNRCFGSEDNDLLPSHARRAMRDVLCEMP